MTLLLTASTFFSAMLIFASITIWQSIFLFSLIGLAITYFVMRDALLSLPWSWQLLQITKEGECRLIQKDGVNFLVNIKADSFVSAYLTILHIALPEYRWYEFWKHRYVILLQDHTDAESFRKLRVYLRWNRNVIGNNVNSSI